MKTLGTLHNKHLYNTKIACDARCQSASLNSKCECACNGANHARAVYVEVDNGFPMHQPITDERVAEGIAFRALYKEYVGLMSIVREKNVRWHLYNAAVLLVDAARSKKKFVVRESKLVAAINILKGLI